MGMQPLERVLIELPSGKAITGHYLGANGEGDPLIGYHDHPGGDSWGRHRPHEVIASGETCTCDSARHPLG